MFWLKQNSILRCFVFLFPVSPFFYSWECVPFGGGCSLFVAFLRCVEGFRVWHFDAQWSPGLANSLWRDEISGAGSQYLPWESLALSCAVWFSRGSSRLAVGPCRP